MRRVGSSNPDPSRSEGKRSEVKIETAPCWTRTEDQLTLWKSFYACKLCLSQSLTPDEGGAANDVGLARTSLGKQETNPIVPNATNLTHGQVS